MQCESIESYNDKGEPIFRKKKKFNTLDQAIEHAKYLNSQDTTLTKLVAYKCSECCKYHIGRNGRTLKEKDKLKYKNYLNEKRAIK